MAEDTKTALLSKLLESVPVLLILLGFTACLLGLAGGVTYHSWFEIKEPIPRIGAGVLGIVLIIAGVMHPRVAKEAPVRVSDYGIKIVHPMAGERVAIVDVKGSIARPLPNGYSLRILRIYPGSNDFVPLAKARFVNGGKSWVAEGCNPGGKPGDKRAFAAYIVGAGAEVLINFHNQAVATHRKTMDDFKNATGGDAAFLSPIAGRTEDMYECDRVDIIRS